MTVLVFDNLDTAQIALDKINENMGCPYTLPNGYSMLTWADILKKYDEDLWGFAKPDEQFMNDVSGWIEEIQKFTSDWYEPSD